MNEELTMARRRPCIGCRLPECPGKECPRWQTWFLESWEGVNRYAWEQMDRLGKTEPRGFVYELPHMVKSPCKSCRCSAWCDRCCSLRIKWWDAQMGRIRKRGGCHAQR